MCTYVHLNNHNLRDQKQDDLNQSSKSDKNHETLLLKRVSISLTSCSDFFRTQKEDHEVLEMRSRGKTHPVETPPPINNIQQQFVVSLGGFDGFLDGFGLNL